MPAMLYQTWLALCAGCMVVSLIAALAFLISALIHWREPFRNRRLAWFAILAAAPFVTGAVNFGMLHWVYGPDTDQARQQRITSGIALTLAPAVALLITVLVSRRRPSFNRRLARFALVAAVPFVLAAVHFVLLFHVLLPSMAQQAKLTNLKRIDDVTLVHAGDAAPQFHLATDGGAAFDLNEQRGNVVLLNFFATWCGPCLAELPLVEETWKEHRDRSDFSLLVIGRDETPESVAAFRNSHKFTFPMAADPRKEVFSLFARELIPRTFLIGRDGTVRLSLTGFDREEFEELRQILNEELDRPQ